MADQRSETTEAEAVPQPALLVPVMWCVVCPACGVQNDIEHLREDEAGAILAADGDQFLHCEECGAFIEAVGVQVTEAYPK